MKELLTALFAGVVMASPVIIYACSDAPERQRPEPVQSMHHAAPAPPESKVCKMGFGTPGGVSCTDIIPRAPARSGRRGPVAGQPEPAHRGAGAWPDGSRAARAGHAGARQGYGRAHHHARSVEDSRGERPVPVKREPGFYWVLHYGEKKVAEWDLDFGGDPIWWVGGCYEPLCDSDRFEVLSGRLTSPTDETEAIMLIELRRLCAKLGFQVVTGAIPTPPGATAEPTKAGSLPDLPAIPPAPARTRPSPGAAATPPTRQAARSTRGGSRRSGARKP